MENAKYVTLKMNAGLACDGKYNTENLNLYNYNNIYFPDENFYNTNKFPAEWMEMFDPGSVRIGDEIEEEEEYEKYSPKCTPNELKKMIDYDAYKGKLKYKNRKSKF